MSVSPGNLDSLLNETFPDADFTSASVQSETGAALNTSGNATYSTVTLDTTGVPGPGTDADESLTIKAVNDTDNSLTLVLTLPASLSLPNEQIVGQETFYVVGYSSDGLLLSGVVPNSFAAGLGGPLSGLNDVVGILSSSPIPAGTNITFSSSGSSDLTPPTTTTPPTNTTAPPPRSRCPQTTE